MSTLITYHESLAPITEKVIQKFCDAWWRVGYQPLVVTPYTDYPEGIPQLNAFLKKVVKYPTVNAKDYELLCYYRWLHIHRTMLANSIESAWILDYDVLPNKKHEFFTFPTPTQTTSYEHVACCYWLREDLEDFIHLMQSIPPWQIDRRHMSDMTIFEHKFRPPAGYDFSVTNYPDASGDLIHFYGCHQKEAMLAY